MTTQSAAKPKSRDTRVAKRQRAADMRRAAKAEAAQRQEDRDEAIAPAITRTAVLDASGAVLRAPRVERDGVAFIRSSPIRHLVARWKAREADGSRPLITERHLAVCDRLCMAWEEGGQGIGMGASDYGRMSQSRGSAAPDFSPQMLAKIRKQREQRAIFEGAMTWMGALSPVIRRVVVEGADLSVWAAETATGRNAAPGYLAAALDRLAEFFAKMDASKEARRDRHQPIRTIEFAPPDAHLVIENIA
jgi:hypothetical protein